MASYVLAHHPKQASSSAAAKATPTEAENAVLEHHGMRHLNVNPAAPKDVQTKGSLGLTTKPDQTVLKTRIVGLVGEAEYSAFSAAERDQEQDDDNEFWRGQWNMRVAATKAQGYKCLVYSDFRHY